MTSKLDLSLYLVHQTESLHASVSFESALKDALAHCTIVQLREKYADTGKFVELAQTAKRLCDEAGVPLLINDRIDVALAVGAAGVHIGQDDMPLTTARKLLGPDAIIGVSAKTAAQARDAIAGSADYLGIGACYETLSKADVKSTLGPRGIAEILESIGEAKCQTVGIGGINAANAARVLHGAVAPSGRTLDGIAVISAIISSPDPKARAQELRQIVEASRKVPAIRSLSTVDPLREALPALFKQTREKGGLIQQTDSANITIAVGASPIMASLENEAADLSPILGALCINLGTLNVEQIAGMYAAGRLANQNRKPIVFDPVGVGATELRRTTTKSAYRLIVHALTQAELLNHWQATIIKGNSGEIAHIAGVKGATSRGVDSEGTLSDPASVVRTLARKERAYELPVGI